MFQISNRFNMFSIGAARSIVLFIGIFLVHHFRPAEAVTICQADYKFTNYYLYCSQSSERVFVTRVVGAFSNGTSSNTIATQLSCYSPINQLLNSSNANSLGLCHYCFNQQQCTITQSIVEATQLFSANSYNSKSVPVSVSIYYDCATTSSYQYSSCENYLINLLPTTTSTTTTTTTTTRTTTRTSTTTKTSTTTRTTTTTTTTTTSTSTSTTTTITTTEAIETSTTSTSYVYCLSGGPSSMLLAEAGFVARITLASFSVLIMWLNFH